MNTYFKKIFLVILCFCIIFITGCNSKTKYEIKSFFGDPSALFSLGMMYIQGNGVEKNPQKGIELLKRSALKNYPFAQYNLGVFYSEGDIVEKDVKQAIEWYKKAANAKNFDIKKFPYTVSMEAQYSLGCIYGLGEGVDKDYKQAFEWFKKGADQGDANCKFNLATLYYNGDGVDKDYKEAFKWYKEAAEIGNPIIEKLSLRVATSDGLPLYSQGLPHAQYRLSQMYFEGTGVQEDTKEALKWLRKSAKQEYKEAVDALNKITKETNDKYEQGFSDYCAPLYKDAFASLKEAAEFRNAYALYFVSLMYEVGKGTEKNEEEAKKNLIEAEEEFKVIAEDLNIDISDLDFKTESAKKKNCLELLKRIANKDVVYATSALGMMYETGLGVEKNEKEGFVWTKKAALKDFVIAEHHLAWLYELGRGVDKDEKTAVKWYKKAAEKGFAKSQHNLALMYDVGSGVNKDYKTAFKWYKKAAEQNYLEAIVEVSYCYEEGIGVAKDSIAAEKWYSKAETLGYEEKEIEEFIGMGVVDPEYHIGVAYYDGNQGARKLRFRKNRSKAITWLKKSANNGFREGQRALGLVYFFDDDYVEALHWLKKAAEKDDDTAQLYLGFIYHDGLGVDRDILKGLYWIDKAAENGNEQAKEIKEKYDSL